ncbi:MAG: class I SAM-dependent methyltransferase [Firmicutes bacterium]|nr:class I SAM-dependent methyltransferase [Bacillota bacterium]
MNEPRSTEYSELLAELYDAIPIYAQRQDVDFYLELARQAAGPVLELGCGTGRILIPTARAGCRITGLDSSENMLARCRTRLAAEPEEVRERVQLLCASMTKFHLGQPYQLITTPFRGFQHLLTTEEQLSCLRCVHRHLAPGGTFVLDVFHTIPAATFDPAWMEEKEDTPETRLPDGRCFLRTVRVAAFHRSKQMNEVEFVFYLTHPGGQKERFVERFRIHYFFRCEVEHLLARAGFRIAAVYGNYDRSPFTDDSPEMIFVAERE